jgi:two-component system, cell cycle sensor histidine kinase and response regulator CckA
MGQPIRVLLVEDNPNDAELVLRELRRAEFEPNWKRVETEQDLLDNLDPDLDIILSDYQMPQFNGLRALELVQQREREIPFIIISGTIGEDIAVTMMKGGATDYLLKDQLARLGQAVTNALADSRLRRERLAMDEALKQAEARYRGIFENALEGIYQSTPQGKFLTANPAMARILGYPSPDDLIQGITNIFDELYLNSEERKEFQRQLHEHGSVSGYEVQLKRKDGRLIWINENVRLVHDKDGSFHYEGMMEDITERKWAEEEVRQSHEKFAALVNTIDGIVWEADAQTFQFSFVSRQAERILGYPIAEWLKEPDFWRKHIYAEDEMRAVSTCLEATEKRRDHEFQYRMVAADGRIVWLHDFITVAVEDNQPVKLRGIMVDITKHKQGEDELRASEERYRSLVEASSQVVWTTDAEGNVTSVSNLEGLVGQGSDLNGWNWMDTLHPEDLEPIVNNWKERLRSTQPVEIEYRQKHPDGTYHFWNSRGIPIFGEDGRVSGWIGMANDITERKQLEQQFFQAQKMEAVGRLAGGVAHDFNNLLTVIIGFSQLIMNSLSPDNPILSHLKQIEKAGHSAASLTSQLLAFSRKQILQTKVFSLNQVVIDLQKMLRRLIGEDVDLITDLAEDLGQVKADPGQIEQIIINLAVNARDAMPQGGKLIIETENVEFDETYARNHAATQPGQYVMLAVSDTGCGMDKTTQERVFEPFFTTKEQGKGTGLGLSTVYGIVKQSGGNIWLYSEKGKGTTVKVYLPLVADEADNRYKYPQFIEILQGTETILLVEDEDMIRRLAYEVLEMNGYRVLEASNANEALQLCQQYDNPIHLLVTDVVLPGLSGHGLANEIALIGREMKVLYMSGYTEDTILHHGVLESGIPFLQKPFTPAALLRKVSEVLVE